VRGSVSQVASGSGGDEACHAPDTGTGRVLLRENPLLRASNEDSFALVRRRDDNQSREARRNAFYARHARRRFPLRVSLERRVFFSSRAHMALFDRLSPRFNVRLSRLTPPSPLLRLLSSSRRLRVFKTQTPRFARAVAISSSRRLSRRRRRRSSWSPRIRGRLWRTLRRSRRTTRKRRARW
jgi:hypothetical protein